MLNFTASKSLEVVNNKRVVQPPSGIYHSTTVYTTPQRYIPLHNGIYHSTTVYTTPQRYIPLRNGIYHSATVYTTPQRYIPLRNGIYHSTTVYTTPQRYIPLRNGIYHSATVYTTPQQYILNLLPCCGCGDDMTFGAIVGECDICCMAPSLSFKIRTSLFHLSRFHMIFAVKFTSKSRKQKKPNEITEQPLLLFQFT